MKNQKTYSQNEIDDALRRYAAGDICRKELAKYGFKWFGDVLEGLARLNLKYPQFDNTIHFNEEQMDLYNKIFSNL